MNPMSEEEKMAVLNNRSKTKYIREPQSKLMDVAINLGISLLIILVVFVISLFL